MTQLRFDRLPTLPAGEFASRRKALFSKLERNSIAIIVSNPMQTRNADCEFPFRQSSDMLYLSNFPEPDSVLVFSNIGGKRQFFMFVQARDPEAEQWDGKRAGKAGARRQYGADRAFTIDQFEDVVSDLLAEADCVYYQFGVNADFDERFEGVWKENQQTLRNPADILGGLRHRKNKREIRIMRYAAEVSATAHAVAMAKCQPGMTEYQLQSIIEHVFSMNGSRNPAYGTIVGGGDNATILHYVENSDELQDGDLVLIDAGCEYLGYAADITRTFPVNGRFSDAQKEIYNLVLEAQMAAIRAARPGVTQAYLHKIAQNRLRRGLVRLGILPAEMITKAGAARAISQAKKADRLETLATLDKFYMHRTGHWLGLDVHDVPADREISGELVLEPGMIITIEPGLYFRKKDRRAPARYRGIGVRIEDDVLVTEDGCEILTSSVPKTVADIEQLMARGTVE